MVVGLIVIGVITVGVKTHINRSLIESSGLTKASLIGWQLIYILPVAILTNDFFLSVSESQNRAILVTLLIPFPAELLDAYLCLANR